MSYHFEPPKRDDYKTEDAFLEALEEWEYHEDEYWEELEGNNREEL